MMTIQIHISNQGHRPAYPATIARWVLGRQGKNCLVSDLGVVSEILAQAKERKIRVQFYARNNRLKKVPLDLAGVKRVLRQGSQHKENKRE